MYVGLMDLTITDIPPCTDEYTLHSKRSPPAVQSVNTCRALKLCEIRGGRPGLSVLTSLMVSVDVKLY